MTVNLLDGQTATPSTSSPNTDYTIGNRFTVSTTTEITGLRWWRRTSTPQEKPYNLKLWGSNTLQPLAVVNVVNDDGATGWQLSSLTGSVELVSGVTYTVSAYWPNGQTWAWIPLASRQAAPSPFTWATNARSFTAGADTFPTNPDNVLVWMIDVQADGVLSGGSPSGGGASAGDVNNTLADWLISTNDNTHQTDGLPWLTRVAVDAIKTAVDGGLNLAGGLQGLSDNLAQTLQLASDYVAGRTSTYFTDLKNRLIGASGGGGSAFYGPGGTQVAEGVETLLAQNLTPDNLGAAVALIRERVTLSPDLADTSRWTLVDTVTGEDDALVELQADLFRVTIGDAPGTHGPQLVGGVEWRPRWGWIAPRVHGCYLQRQPLVDLSPFVVAPGLFMDGLLLYSHPGFTWLVEAFVLDRT